MTSIMTTRSINPKKTSQLYTTKQHPPLKSSNARPHHILLIFKQSFTMRKMSYLILGSIMMILSSCGTDTGTAEVSYLKADAIYGNLEDSRNEALNEPSKEIVNPGKIYIGEDFILIGEEGEGIHVVDNSNPSNPVQTNFINIPGNKEFFVEGDKLYAESIYDFLKIDISNLNAPSLESRALDAIAAPSYDDKGNALLGFSFKEVTETIEIGSVHYQEVNQYNYAYFDYLQNVIPNSAVPSSFAGTNGQSGTVNRIAVNEDNIYVITKNDLKVLEQNGSNVELITNHPIWGTTLETVFYHDDHIFLGTTNSMEIYDVTTPAQPRQLDRFSHATSCDPVLPKGDVAYVTLRTGDESRACPGDINALVTVNIENYQNIFPTSEIPMASPFGMTSKNEILYVGEGQNGLKIFDVSNPESPSLIKHDQGIEAYDIITHPSNSSQILIAGPNGLSQYLISEDLDFQLESTILY